MKKLNFLFALTAFALSVNFSYAQSAESKIRNLKITKSISVIYENDPLGYKIDTAIAGLEDRKIQSNSSTKNLKQCYAMTAGSKRTKVFQQMIGKCKNDRDIILLYKFLKKNNYPGYFGIEYHLLAEKRVDIIIGKENKKI